MDARRLSFSHDWDVGGPRAVSRAKVIGGCSTHNACVVAWGSRGDYDEWTPWSFERLAPYLERAERMLAGKPFEDDVLTPWHRAFLSGAVELGIPRLDQFNDLDASAGVAPYPRNARGNTRWNAAFAYLDAARARPNLTIHAERLVERVLVEDGHAVGAVLAGEEVRAGTVVIAAGAFGSPAILLRSGVGPAEELRRHGIEALVEAPVGEGLVDHPGVVVEWAPTQAFNDHYAKDFPPSYCEGQVIVRGCSERCSAGSWDLHVFPRVSPADAPGRHRATAVVYSLKPESRGSVRLASRAPGDGPVINHGHLTADGDAAVIADGVKLARRIVANAAGGRLVDEEMRPGEAPMADYVRGSITALFHPVGTCALGRVVNGDCAVVGIERLYVADASVIPTIPRANTNLTTVALAELAADRIGAALA